MYGDNEDDVKSTPKPQGLPQPQPTQASTANCIKFVFHQIVIESLGVEYIKKFCEMRTCDVILIG